MESNKTDPKPSVQQQAIVDWALHDSGHLNVVARAGSGKTSTLIMLAKALAATQQTMLLCAFNRAIADELVVKLAKNGIPTRWAYANTLHGVGMRALTQKFGGRPDLSEFKTYKVMDMLLTDGEISGKEHDHWSKFIAKMLEHGKLAGVSVLWEFTDHARWEQLIEHYEIRDSLPETSDPELAYSVEAACKIAAKALKRSVAVSEALIDYNDQLWLPVYLGLKFQTYNFVMIDEAQDTNEIRRELALRCMKKDTGRCIAVGDDKQAIYGFTGADSDAMELIKERLGSKELPLKVTYRSARAIVRAAQRIVPDVEAWEHAIEGVEERVEEKYWDPTELSPTDAVLCRTNAPLVKMAHQCIRGGKPCRIEGRDMAGGLISLIAKWKQVPLERVERELQRWYEKEKERLSKSKAKDVDTKRQKLDDKHLTLHALMEATFDCYGEGALGVDMQSIIKRMFGLDQRGRQSKQVLVFSSVHKAKGKEWDAVYVYAANTLMPHPMAIADWELEQEEHLIYVATTRAKTRLVWVDVEKPVRTPENG